MSKSFFEVIGKMGSSELARRTFKNTMKERDAYVRHNIDTIMGDIDDLCSEEFDAVKDFITAERKDTSSAKIALERIVALKEQRAELESMVESLEEVYKMLFKSDAESVAEAYGVDLSEAE